MFLVVTFGKVLVALDFDAFERRIQLWVHAWLGSHTQGKHFAIADRTSVERRHFTSSHSGRQAQKLTTLIRNHWRVENQLHGTLDVSFNEDQCCVRIEIAAENLTRIRRISLTLLKREKSCKLGIKSKRIKAA